MDKARVGHANCILAMVNRQPQEEPTRRDLSLCREQALLLAWRAWAELPRRGSSAGRVRAKDVNDQWYWSWD